MRSALFGHSGFVGSALLRHRAFDSLYNSSNLEDARGCEFDIVYCAALPAAKWIANRDPAADKQNLDRLTDALSTLNVGTFVLASTVDVYPVPCGVDESASIDEQACHPYGLHRLILERFVEQRFDRFLILRLPALFGAGLRKNAIYDLLHDNQVHLIHPAARYQFYDVERLADDADRFLADGHHLVNLATEPVSMGEIAAEVFGTRLSQHDSKPAFYDFRSGYASSYGGKDGYFVGRDETMTELRKFVQQERASGQ